MVKILFDGHIFIDQVAGGISRYYNNLAVCLNAMQNVDARIVSPIHRNEYLSKEKAAPLIGYGVPPNWRAGRIAWAALQTTGPLISKIINPDIVHETYFSPKPLLKYGKRRVTTVYDMIHELYFPGSETSKFKQETLARCDHVICISENTKKDLCEIFNFPPKKVSVTHLAYQSFANQMNDVTPKIFTEKPYFLFVGNRGFYKNFELLLRAISKNKNLKNNFRIIAFGGGAFTKEETEIIAKLQLSSDLVLQLNGDDVFLGQAYVNATALVYPSAYEGFGIPPLEAMSAGCPVISSNSSSLPEVVGDAALLINPKEMEELSEAMERLVLSDELRQQLISSGYERCKFFSWQRCAQETLNIYKGII